MAEVDTSSYPKPGLPVSPLEMAGKLGSIQQQKLSIDQAKLDQANQGLTYMTRAMGALGPNAPKEAYIKAAGDAVKLGLVPAQQLQVFVDKAQAAPTSKAFYDEFMTTAADHQQQINYHLGANANLTDNANIYSGVQKPVSQGGGFIPATQSPIQPPPTQPTVNNQPTLPNGQPNPNYLQPGIVGASAPPGVYPARPGALPVAPLNNAPTAPVASPAPMPVARPSLPTTGPTGPTVQTGHDFNQRFAGAPIVTGGPPMYEPGQKAYTADQLSASARSQAIKPAIQALKLMPGLSTGPGTEQFNTAVAALKAWGLTDIKETDDPTVIRQEINKKLAQYVGNNPNVSRSDASQALAEAGSPNAKTQILPALMNLTRDAVALDRVKILQPQAFKGADYQNYIKHQGTFPGGVDEKALTLDMLPDKERTDLVNKMVTMYKKGNADEKARANKFLNTLKLASEHNIFEGAQ